MKKTFSTFILLSSLLTGCATEDTSLPATGHAPGLLTGSSIASVMKDSDSQQLIDLLNTAKPHASRQWKNADTGVSYTFTSKRVFLDAEEQPCRTYQIASSHLLLRHQAEETACRDDEGKWTVQENH